MTDVLFTTTPLLETCIGGLCPSLTFLQLGSYLQARGHRVRVHDVAVERDLHGLAMDQVVALIAGRVIEAAPQVLGLSCKVPADGRFCLELLEQVRPHLPELTVLVGGIWASPCSEQILERIPAIDGVVLGEGERALGAICDRLEAGEPPFAPDVPGVAYRSGAGAGGIVVTPRAPPLLPTEHPPLDLGLMPQPSRYTVFPFLTSKGCPYQCTFCAERVIFPDYVEVPIEQIRADLDRIEAFGQDWFLWLSDPLFGANPRRLEAICERLEGSRFHFLLESRVDVLRPEQLPTLWEAGCDLIYFGLESAAFETLRRIGKISSRGRHQRYLRQARALMEACMQADITPIFGVLNPVPGDTPLELEQTLAFLGELREIAQASADRAGHDPGFHFYGFDYRFIRGTLDFQRLDTLAELGATWRNEPDDVLRDVVIDRASPSVDRMAAQIFQQKVSALVRTTPKGWERLQRSFPPQPLGGLG